MKPNLLILLQLVIPLSISYAVREPPDEVRNVRHDGMIIKVPHFGVFVKGTHGEPKQNGGYVEAFDAKTGELIWSVKIYDVEYEEGIESDIFDVFIKEIQLVRKFGILLIRDEKDRIFALSLDSKSVTRIQD